MMEWDKLCLTLGEPGALEKLLALQSSLLRHRLFILRMLGWPKEPTMKGNMPTAVTGFANHSPLGDLDVASMPDATLGAAEPEGGESCKTPDVT